jgi:hypothetical protein
MEVLQNPESVKSLEELSSKLWPEKLMNPKLLIKDLYLKGLMLGDLEVKQGS